ncbi:MAG TPA: pitrilysin family protein [Candidatus Binatia bacterium]|jgi:predicted Zn-dependent peptidase|nr:pitrilysin family protein [Candidatus Binatia bacterium]
MQATRLPNGVRVLSERLPDLPSVTAGIWVENGSRYERPEQAGISHFLEHLFFKGTASRTAAQIAEEIDAVGGVLNAFTGKEYTCYYAKVLPEHLPLALDILSDIFTHSRFASEEIERERSVILQEISQIEDTPDDYVHELFNQAFWPGHPLSRPIAGVPETVSAFERDDFLRFLDARYRPDRLLIAAAGNLRHDDLLEMASRQFSALAGAAMRVDGAPPSPAGGVVVHEKPLEQVHLCLGAPGIAQGDPDRYAVHVLNAALGGGMSSRLFQEIRERRGKAYTVYSFLSSYADVGYIGVYVGTSAEWTREVVDVVRTEIARTTREGLGAAELARVKTQMKGSMLLGLETSDSRMTRIAKNDIYFGRDVPLEEVAAGIDAVTNDDVVRAAARLFGPRTLALTVLGDLKGQALGDEVLAG